MEKKFDALTMHVSSKIEEYRSESGITQETLAIKTGISRASMVNMENGRQGVSLRRLFDMAVELGIEAKDLLPTNEWYKEYKNKQLKKIITFEVVDMPDVCRNPKPNCFSGVCENCGKAH